MTENPQLIALALFEAYHHENNEDFQAIMRLTPTDELNRGIVLLTLGLFASLAVAHGKTVDEMIGLIRLGLVRAGV